MRRKGFYTVYWFVLVLAFVITTAAAVTQPSVKTETKIHTEQILAYAANIFLKATEIPTPTAESAPTPSPNTPQIMEVRIEASLMPRETINSPTPESFSLFAKLDEDFGIGISEETIEAVSFDPMEKFIVVSLGIEDEKVTYGSALLSPGQLPVLENVSFGPPCPKGSGAYATGYMYSTNHLAVDIACSKGAMLSPNNYYFEVAAPAECIITSIVNYAGVTPICSTALTGGAGTIHFAFGHMDNSLQVELGQTLEAGQVIGIISTQGTTGYTTGPHIHYFVIYEDATGYKTHLNPVEYGALGRW